MTRTGLLGLLLGGLLGLLVVIIFFVILARQAASFASNQAIPTTSDLRLFLSDRTLSRLASAEMGQPVVLGFEPGGRVEVTTQIELGGLEPVVHLGLSLDMQGVDLVSRLQWVKIGFLTVPAGWLPEELTELGAIPGEVISAQLPPEFSLSALETTSGGLNVHLNWRGQ